jgi:hypothetical protein
MVHRKLAHVDALEDRHTAISQTKPAVSDTAPSSLHAPFKEIPMIRTSIVATVLAATMAFACDNASDEQKKMNAAQSQADDKISAATKEADQKVRSAQQEEDQKIAAAQSGFMKLREDYRHTTTTNLVELDRSVNDLEAKSRQTMGKTKSDLDATLKQIHADRGAFETHYRALESATASTWDEAKSRLDAEWNRLKALVDKA